MPDGAPAMFVTETRCTTPPRPSFFDAIGAHHTTSYLHHPAAAPKTMLSGGREILGEAREVTILKLHIVPIKILVSPWSSLHGRREMRVDGAFNIFMLSNPSRTRFHSNDEVLSLSSIDFHMKIFGVTRSCTVTCCGNVYNAKSWDLYQETK
jgi:hypothetical protein